MFVYYIVLRVLCLEETRVRLSDIPVATGVGIVSVGCVVAILIEWVGPHDTSAARLGLIGGATWA